MTRRPEARSQRRTRGQTVTEFALAAPVLLLFMLGVSDVGYGIYQSQVIATLAREGANLISRHGTLADAETALRAVASGPVAFDTNGTVILSVLKLGTGGANKDKPILAQRHRFGALNVPSALGDPPAGAFRSDPEHAAVDALHDPRLRVDEPLPHGLTLVPGESIYVAEVHLRRTPLTPVGLFGIALPDELSAWAYF
jgi:hypothetical protein